MTEYWEVSVMTLGGACITLVEQILAIGMHSVDVLQDQFMSHTDSTFSSSHCDLQ